MAEEDNIFEELLLSGAVEPSGMDIETGDMLFNFTDKLKDVNPELHNEFSNYFYQEVRALWENGFLDMDILEENPMITITPKALDKKQVQQLDKDRQYTLKEIIRIILRG